MKTKKSLEPWENGIGTYIHCSKCISEIPEHESPKHWQRIQAGFTKEGLQIWCTRHECNILHIDFEGVKHPGCVETGECPYEAYQELLKLEYIPYHLRQGTSGSDFYRELRRLTDIYHSVMSQILEELSFDD